MTYLFFLSFFSPCVMRLYLLFSWYEQKENLNDLQLVGDSLGRGYRERECLTSL